jgi:ornithine carbamoyltransferase
MGMNFTAVTNKKYYPAKELIDTCKEIAAQTGATINFTEDAMAGTKGADVICTDIWVSMGEPESAWAERIKDLSPYRVTMDIMNNAGPDSVFMHCLPSFHDLGTSIGREIKEKFGLDEIEVTNEVFESDRSIVFDEAENRMHTIKAVMYATLKG